MDCLIGLEVHDVHRESGNPWFNSCLRCEDFSRLSGTRDFKNGIPVATLPRAGH